jgi:hypothetical protein
MGEGSALLVLRVGITWLQRVLEEAEVPRGWLQ